MAEQRCPVCGCAVDENSYEKDGVLYCCETCATEGWCPCGCEGSVKELEKNK
ncbi:MAG: metallothionein [Dehalococcoidia bacterium]